MQKYNNDIWKKIPLPYLHKPGQPDTTPGKLW
jgi:hypothetical protein